MEVGHTLERRYPLEQIAEPHRYVEEGTKRELCLLSFRCASIRGVSLVGSWQVKNLHLVPIGSFCIALRFIFGHLACKNLIQVAVTRVDGESKADIG